MDSLLIVNRDSDRSNEIYLETFSTTLSFVLNISLGIVTCLFIFSSLNYVYHQSHHHFLKDHFDEISLTTIDPWQAARKTKTYFDFEKYFNNGSLNASARSLTRQSYFIDVGCFDGRDIDHFIHFHWQEIKQKGKLQIFAFDADPINFSACKSAEKRHPRISHTFIDSAAWIEDGIVEYSFEKGQRSRIDLTSSVKVESIDFSSWLSRTVSTDDYVHVKITVEGAEIPILEKLVYDQTLALIDYLDIEWNDGLAAGLEPRRISLECMFDNFGMDFLFMVNPVDVRHAYNIGENFTSVPTSNDWLVHSMFSLSFFNDLFVFSISTLQETERFIDTFSL